MILVALIGLILSLVIGIFHLAINLKSEKSNKEFYLEKVGKLYDQNLELRMKLNSDKEELLAETLQDFVPVSEHQRVIENLSNQWKELHQKVCIQFATLEQKHNEVLGKQKSEQVRLGKVSENILPFLENFPYDKENVRGLFNPIDMVVFGEEEIVFVEIKTGNSQLSQKQRKIKKLVDEKKVRFEMHRMDENGYKIV